MPCSKIDAAWGAQRIKGLSLSKTLLHAGKKISGSCPQGGHRAERDGNLAHREVSLSEVRPGADVARDRAQGDRDGRRDPARRSAWTA